MERSILIATQNKHKRIKLANIVRGFFDKIDFPETVGLTLDARESGNTFKENAAEKARTLSETYEGYVIATDGGMSIPALGDKWNKLRTRRFAGENATDLDRIKSLLKLMEGLEGKDRLMLWTEALAIAKDGKLLFIKEVEGARGIATKTFSKQCYAEGIWMCSVWYFPQFKKNYFELNKVEKLTAEVSWNKLKTFTRGFFTKSAGH